MVEAKALYRFFTKINFNGPKIVETPCWEWIGAKNHEGYGQIWVGNGTVRAPRFILELCMPKMPRELVTRHRCDNTACVNPLHLEPGTKQENNQDKVERDRMRGKTNRRYGPEMREILLKEIAAGLTQRAAGEKYGMVQRTVRKIIRGDRMKDAMSPEEVKAISTAKKRETYRKRRAACEARKGEP